MGIIPLRQGLKHYSRHGELPETPVWKRLETRHDQHPALFDRMHPILAGLFDEADTPGLMPDTPYWDRLRGRYELDAARFKHYHPFLGKLVERDERVRDTLDDPIPTPSTPPPLVNPPLIITPGDGGDGTTTIPGGGGSGGITGVAVPEPPGAILFALGLLACAALAGLRRRKTSVVA